jgi:Ca2+-transporting ATPase
MQTEDAKNRFVWHTLDKVKVLDIQNVVPDQGLEMEEVKRRQSEFGPNELVERGLKSPWRILLEQFTDAMVIVLLVAAVISFFVKDLKDAIIILAIVLLNSVLGFTQEYRAERAMAALKRMAAPMVKVIREGLIGKVDSSDLVPGDIFQLEAGDAVPADARLLEVANLRLQESSLTGESLPAEKSIDPIAAESIPLGDRHNMVYLGTSVTYGRGTALVVETGMKTELGRIAELIQSVESEQTPLQKRMARLGGSLAFAAIGIVVIVFILGAFRGENLKDMFFTAIALAVAAVPEGLPAVVTISLALGAQRMLRRQALIRKLPAVETLGSVTVICSDKTGTLTENRMAIKILDVAERTVDIEETLRQGMPILRADDSRQQTTWRALSMLLVSGALCNDALIQPDPEIEGDFRTLGDPTEGALLVAAARHNLWKADLERILPRVAEVPFSSERKRMTSVHKITTPDTTEKTTRDLCLVTHGENATYVAFTKGAVDGLVSISDRVWVKGDHQPMDENWRRRILAANDRMAEEGLRVLGLACRSVEALPSEKEMEGLEQDLVFIGMVGMLDPPRPEVKKAVATCKTAGVRPVMITGDHPLTAQRIAQDLGISSNGRTITGADLEKLGLADLEAIVEQVPVYARVSPEHKLNIVNALQKQGHIVAMTGDGVNDAPALRRSDIGVAMGITGTDVAKEAADMVILDDNFATIVEAVEEGRTIYDNVRKFVKYTLTSNVGEILVMLLAPIIGMPIPLTALQILWINLVTDGLPGLALGLEPPEPDIMRRPPHPPNESIFARGMGGQTMRIGLLMGLVSLGVGFWGWKTGNPHWKTMVFTTLTLAQMGNALAIRSFRESLFTIGITSNKPILGAVLLTCTLQLMVMYLAPLQDLFSVIALPPFELVISLVASLSIFVAVEFEKFILRRRGRHDEITAL